MHVSRWIGVSLLPAAVVAITAARSPAHSEAAAVAHVRRHLDSVLVELGSHDVSALSDAQRARRAGLVHTLAGYRDRGDFPHNYDFPGQLVPYFRDRVTGTLCAVGYLLASTGRGDIVERVVAADNNVRVAQLAGDTALTHWLDTNGLTVAEAARIQVVYAQSVSPAQIAGTVAIGLLAPISVSTSVYASIRNLTGNSDGQRRFVTGLGMVSGVVSVGTGVALLHSDIPRSYGAVATTVGVAGVALSVRSLRRHHEIMDAQQKQTVASVSLVPTLDVSGRNGVGPSTGAAVAIRF